MDNIGVDYSRRNFMKGMAKVSVVGGVLATVPFSYQILSSDNNQAEEYAGFDANSFLHTYENFSYAALGTAVSGFVLNNMEMMYSMMLIIVAFTIFITFGVPAFESLFYPNTEILIPQT
tara:strand:+ start:2123 stop:2479 length:357 start_codon:yes stop_codon:yes gene_type:complete